MPHPLRFLTPVAVFFAVASVSLGARVARADDAAPSSAVAVPAGESGKDTKDARQGLGVLGVGDAQPAAFVLARALYASRLRPPGLDEKRARVLAGESAAADAPTELKDLAELRAAVSGEDAASRKLLAGLCEDFKLAGIVVVSREATAAPGGDAAVDPAPVTARLFVASTGEFDAARYAPLAGVSGAAAWRPVVGSLEQRFPAARPAVTGALSPTAASAAPRKASENESRPFYASPWFWGALGAAALLGTGAYFASRSSSSDSINLQLRVP